MFVFLDIDGVLNREADWVVPYTLNKNCLDNFAECFEGIDIKIILTSSWRTGFVSPGNSKNTKQIQELEKQLLKRGLSIRGITKTSVSNRAQAVKDVLNKISDNYIILDDDLSEFCNEKINNLYLTNSKTGFTKKDAKKIRKTII